MSDQLHTNRAAPEVDASKPAIPPRAFIALLLGAVAIGFAPILMRLSGDVGTTAAAFWRGGLSIPLMLLLYGFMRARGTMRAFTIREVAAVSVIGFFFAVDLFFWHWSVSRTTVANATLLSNLAALFTALFGVFVLRQRMKGGFYIGLLLAFAGAATLVGVNAEIRPDYLFGDFLGVLTAVAYAAYIISVARVRQGMSTAKVMIGSTIAMSAFLLPMAVLEDAPLIPETTAGWAPLLWLALISHTIGQSLIAFGLASVPAALGSLTLLIQPVIAAVLAWVLFAESLGPAQLVGAALVLIGVYRAKRAS